MFLDCFVLGTFLLNSIWQYFSGVLMGFCCCLGLVWLLGGFLFSLGGQSPWLLTRNSDIFLHPVYINSNSRDPILDLVMTSSCMTSMFKHLTLCLTTTPLLVSIFNSFSAPLGPSDDWTYPSATFLPSQTRLHNLSFCAQILTFLCTYGLTFLSSLPPPLALGKSNPGWTQLCLFTCTQAAKLRRTYSITEMAFTSTVIFS